MGNVRDILAWVAGVLAMASITYGAFQEPLVPYMQGIMGGVMDVYRLLRDYIFDGLGWTLSGVINLIGRWITWLPPAPWFSLPPFVKDLATYFALWIGSLLGARQSFNLIIGYAVLHEIPIEGIRKRNINDAPSELQKAVKRVLSRLLIALFLVRMFVGELPKEFSRYYALIIGFLSVILLTEIIFGAVAFFLLVYAENQIGF